jgi:hypothetical protein
MSLVASAGCAPLAGRELVLDSRGRVTGDSSGGGRSFPRPGVRGDHCADQRIAQPRTKTGLRGPVIVEVFVERRGHHVLHGSFHRVRGEAETESFAETGGAAAESFGIPDDLP